MTVKVGFHGEVYHTLSTGTGSRGKILFADSTRHIELELTLQVHPGQHPHDSTLQMVCIFVNIKMSQLGPKLSLHL